MSIGPHVQAWRASRKLSVASLSEASGISFDFLEQIEAELADPPASTLAALAGALGIPIPWLFENPQHFDALFKDADDGEEPASSQVDPVTEHILGGYRMDRSLYVLLTVLMQAGDPKLLRAAEVSLRSLVKHTRQATVPWQQRPSGHFEPPSD
jgi:transcriptional regulator with XRE-family HTH domain